MSSNFRLTFAWRESIHGLRIRGAGLLAERLSRCAPALSPSYSRKHIGYGDTPHPFQVWSRHPWRKRANDGRSTVRTGETPTLERVLQATGRYSMRRCGEVFGYMRAFIVYAAQPFASVDVQRGCDSGVSFECPLAAEYIPASTTTSWSYAHQLKAGESNLGVLTEMSGEVVSL